MTTKPLAVGAKVRISEAGLDAWETTRDDDSSPLKHDAVGEVTRTPVYGSYYEVRFEGCGESTWPMFEHEIEVNDDDRQDHAGAR